MSSLFISDSIFSQSRCDAYGLTFLTPSEDAELAELEAGGGKTTLDPSKVGQSPEFSFLRIISTYFNC